MIGRHKITFSLYTVLIFAVLLLCSGFGVGILLSNVLVSDDSQSQETHLGGYKLINPLLFCNQQEGVGSSEYRQLEGNIEEFILSQIEKGAISHASVYFRDLNNGPWFGVSEEEAFSPSSLLKLPVLMAYYKEAEINPAILSQKVRYSDDLPLLEQGIPVEKQLEKGKEYSVEELLERMIVYSDNASLVLLENIIPGRSIDKVTEDVGIVTPTAQTPEDYMTVKDYSSLFRILYNASYLSRNYSEKALDLLTKGTFSQGLRAGVPEDVLISHKFGERELPNLSRQLHDCGIVYYTDHPYLLCVMTRGNDYNQLSSVISSISQQVYAEVDRHLKAGE